MALARDAANLKGQVEAARSEGAKLTADRDRLRAEQAELEKVNKIVHDELHALQAQSDALTKETGELRSRLKVLEENVGRMRRAREEVMAGLGTLGKEMTHLGIGGKD